MRYYRQQDFADPVLAAHGCALATAVNAMIHASGGDWKPSGKNATDSARARLATSGASDREFIERGVTADELRASLDRVGGGTEWMDLPVKAYHGAKVSDMLDKMVEVKGCLAVAIRNRELVKAGKSPFRTFMGGHWILVIARVGAEVRYVDAGVGKVRSMTIKLLTDAMDHFGDRTPEGGEDKSWGDGRGEAILVYPWRTWRAGYAIVKGQRDAARTQRDDARVGRDSAVEALNRCLATQQPGGTPAEVIAALEAAATESDRIAGNLVASSADLKRQATSLRAVVATQEGP